MMTIEQKKQVLRKEMDKLEVYEHIRNKIMQEIEWNYMKYHQADETHDDYYYTIPDTDDYNYDKYMASMEIVEALDKYMKL